MQEKAVFDVSGMTCSSCAQGINRHLTKKGLHDIDIDFESGIVEVSIDEKTSREDIIREINSLGYQARLKGDLFETSGFIVWIKTLEARFILSLLFTTPLLLHMYMSLPLLHDPLFQFLMCLPVFIIGLIHFGRSAWGSVKHSQPNMDVLIMLGSGAAFIYSFVGWILYAGSPEVHNFLFFETCATIITLVLLGNIIEKRSLKRTQSALEALSKIQPLHARLNRQ